MSKKPHPIAYELSKMGDGAMSKCRFCNNESESLDELDLIEIDGKMDRRKG